MNARSERGVTSGESTLLPVMLVSRCLIGQDGRLLFVQRAQTDRRNPPKWEALGGKVDPGETPEAAGVREAREEIGLDISISTPVVFQYSRLMRGGANHGGLYLSLFHTATVIGGEIQLDENEIADYTWDTHEEALRRDMVPESAAALRALGSRILLSSYF